MSNLIDPAFNGSVFMWDSAFMTMFGHYGARAFDFQQTLDNLYSMQHRDGYICREISIADGQEHFEERDPSNTGHNILLRAEWEYYRQTGDKARLERVFPVLLAYTQWFARNRSWPDGTYFSRGWGCGMDNQPRMPQGFSPLYENGFVSWVDTTMQAIFADRILISMAAALGRNGDVDDLRQEVEVLSPFVNAHFWGDAAAFYFDRMRNGHLSTVKSIAAYWALLADVVPRGNLRRFLDHLRNPAEFDRPDRVPSLSADNHAYQRRRVLAGWRLEFHRIHGPARTNRGRSDSLAHEIALNHVRNIDEVFPKTRTLWRITHRRPPILESRRGKTSSAGPAFRRFRSSSSTSSVCDRMRHTASYFGTCGCSKSTASNGIPLVEAVCWI